MNLPFLISLSPFSVRLGKLRLVFIQVENREQSTTLLGIFKGKLKPVRGFFFFFFFFFCVYQMIVFYFS